MSILSNSTTSRRRFLAYFSGAGLTSTLLPGTLGGFLGGVLLVGRWLLFRRLIRRSLLRPY